MKIYELYGLYGWDEHTAFARTTLKGDHGENHFTATIGVSLIALCCVVQAL